MIRTIGTSIQPRHWNEGVKGSGQVGENRKLSCEEGERDRERESMCVLRLHKVIERERER